MAYSGNLTIAANGYKQNFPTTSPPLMWSLSITALPTNVADVFVAQARISAGRTVTIPTATPESYWLSGAPGDGVTYSGA